MAYATIGSTVVKWDDDEPLIFTMSEETGSKDDRRIKSVQFDLTSLLVGFEDKFLVDLKNVLIDRRNRIALITVKTEYMNILVLFQKVIDHDLFETRISIIDEAFLLALNKIAEELASVYLSTLKRIFNSNPYSPVFVNGLRGEAFPIKSYKKGTHGNRINNILATALSRAACVDILRRSEEAYEDGEIKIGHFSFINLAFAVYCRPDSYRRIRLGDLNHNAKEDTFFLYIPPAKTGVLKPKKICYRINKHVGMLLLKQRQQVIEKFGNLVDQDDIDKLALFPAIKLRGDKSGWFSKSANECFGEIKDGLLFNSTYFLRIKNLVLNGEYGVNARSLRHTVGTQLAQLGCSAKTIQAVLKHACDRTCLAYVDIAFNGLINELSDAMQPAFESCLPVFLRFRSKDDLVAPNKAVFSEDLETGRIELTGECGKQIHCQAAPFICYECNKFIPCFDADHSLNLNIILSEIYNYKRAGTPFRHLVEKAKTIYYRILLVMAACDRYQQADAEQKGCL